MGGLGNQMFQIATAYAYAKRTGGRLQLLREHSTYWNSTLYRWVSYITNSLPQGIARWEEVESTVYTPIPELPTAGMMLQGYFQSSAYFGSSETRREIQEYMKPSPEHIDFIHAKYAKLLSQRDRIVVVHARRTDYLQTQHKIDYHGPLTIDYYRCAMERMRTYVESPIFLLCADDNRFWTENIAVLPVSDTSEYQILYEENDVHALTLLQQFSYFIIANSTFSWWGAWLADARRVIAPARWFGPAGPQQYEDIYEHSWERI